MKQQNAIQVFEERQVRTLWDEEQEKWYISIVDVIAVLTESIDPGAYWRKLKERLKEEGNETVTNCHSLKMRASRALEQYIRLFTSKVDKKLSLENYINQQKPVGLLCYDNTDAIQNHSVPNIVQEKNITPDILVYYQ